MSKNYPLHPGQTHAQPLYAQIPLEEYERLMAENKRLKDVLKSVRCLTEIMPVKGDTVAAKAAPKTATGTV